MLGNAACFKSEMQNELGQGAEFFNSYLLSGRLGGYLLCDFGSICPIHSEVPTEQVGDAVDGVCCNLGKHRSAIQLWVESNER